MEDSSFNLLTMSFFSFELIHRGGRSPIFLFLAVTFAPLACLPEGAIVAVEKTIVGGKVEPRRIKN
jgi:hypothetical protein